MSNYYSWTATFDVRNGLAGTPNRIIPVAPMVVGVRVFRGAYGWLARSPQIGNVPGRPSSTPGEAREKVEKQYGQPISGWRRRHPNQKGSS